MWGQAKSYLGFGALVLGVLIIFGLLMPPWFWLFVGGIGLICYGLWALRCR